VHAHHETALHGEARLYALPLYAVTWSSFMREHQAILFAGADEPRWIIADE
jgi:hypothetical protein